MIDEAAAFLAYAEEDAKKVKIGIVQEIELDNRIADFNKKYGSRPYVPAPELPKEPRT
jgi:hypothetical protein